MRGRGGKKRGGRRGGRRGKKKGRGRKKKKGGGGFFGGMFNKVKNFAASHKDSIINAAKKALPGGAADFMEIATKMSSGDTKGAAEAALDLGAKYITDPTG